MKDEAIVVTIGEGITVNAPIEKVFSYLSDPSNLSEFWPGLVSVADVKSLQDGGYRANWEYKMAGRLFKGTGEYTEIVPNKSLVIETTGDIRSVLTWIFSSQAGRTRVSLVIKYKIPIPLIGKLAEAIILKMNEQELSLMMSNLRARFMFV